MNNMKNHGNRGDKKQKLVDAIRLAKKNEYKVTFDSNHYI